MKKLTSLFLLFACLLMPPSGLGQTAELDAAVDSMMRKSKVVGGSVVVYLRGEMVYARDYGYRNVYRKLPVDEHTCFKTASITKMVTAIGLMSLREKGFVDLDEDISEYFGTKIRNPAFPETPLTLRQLMSHTAGVSDDGGFRRENSRITEMLAYENGRRSNFLDARPGEKYSYSNFGAGIVGAVMESVTGMSVNAYMDLAVFDPLGIDAAYAASLVENTDNLASLYANGGLYKFSGRYVEEGYEDSANPDTHFKTTVGSLWISSRGLARLTSLLCEGGQLDGLRLLKPESVQEMMARQHEMGKSVSGESIYGLHLERQDSTIPGVTLYGHQGRGEGMIVNTYFEPESGFALTLLTNGSSMARRKLVGVLARNLVNHLYPRFTE